MNKNAYLSRSRSKKQEAHHIKSDVPECQKQNSAFTPNHSCHSRSESGDQESSSSEEHRCFHKKFCEMPLIFDRKYGFSRSEICSRNFSLRLGGLGKRMAAKLRQYLGCEIQFGYKCESAEKIIKGRITFVGTDFVEVLTKDKSGKAEKTTKAQKKNKRFHKKEEYTMVPFNSINWLDFD